MDSIEFENFLKQDIKKKYTKQLLKLYREVDIIIDRYTGEKRKRLNDFRREIKLELSTREHIPNKQEAKKIRQEKARKKIDL